MCHTATCAAAGRAHAWSQPARVQQQNTTALLLHSVACADCEQRALPAPPIGGEWPYCDKLANGDTCKGTCTSGYTGSFMSLCFLGTWKDMGGGCETSGE
jgi:hypothetical protein